MDTLKEILDIYDNPDKKKFTNFDITGDLLGLPEDVRNQKDTQSELLAFSFQNNTGKDHWNTYYGPLTTWKRKDTGENILRPDIKDITPDDIAYWESRASISKNPLMKMRYAGLVFDFKKKITGEMPNYEKIIRPYTESIIQVVAGEYHHHSLEGYYFMERALQMASKINAEDLFYLAQKVLWDYDHKVADDNSPGLWGRHFQLMLNYIDRYGQYEIKLVQEHEERFSRLESKALKNGDTTDQYVHLMNDQCGLLCDYYTRKKQPEKAKEHLDRLQKAMRASFILRGGIWAQAMLQRLQVNYRKYNLYKEANRLFIDIQDLGKSALGSMKGHEFSLPIDNNQLNTFVEDFLSGTPRDVFIKYVTNNIPKINIERQHQKEEAEQFPLLDLIRTTRFDSSGIPIKNVGMGKDAEHQKLMYSMYKRMIISAVFLRIEVTKMEEKNILSKDVILDEFKDSLLISKTQFGIFERGIEAYFDHDYLVACHLLIPQFESAIRRLTAFQGGQILRQSKDPLNGNEYIALDSLLDCIEIKDILKEDIQMYFKNIFTDQNGWNLRNLTSHGLFQTNEFNSTVADRIVHAFCLLSMIKFTDSEENEKIHE